MSINAKEEFLGEIKYNGKPICAKIGVDRENYGSKINWVTLPENYTNEELIEFLEKLNFTYDSGYGTQELFGIILFKDSYSDRHEYDGSEYWDNHKKPTVDEVISYK